MINNHFNFINAMSNLNAHTFAFLIFEKLRRVYQHALKLYVDKIL